MKQGWKSQTDSKWEVGTGGWQGRGCVLKKTSGKGDERKHERKKERKKKNREDNKGEKIWKKWNETK